MNKAFFLGLHSLFLSLKQRHQTIFNYSGNFVFSTFDYRLAYGGRGKVQRPCKTGSASVYKNLAQPVNKVPIVDLVLKYGLRSIPQDNDAVQCSGRIYSGFSRHGGRLTFPDPLFSFMSLMLLLKAGWLFICRRIDSRAEPREFFYPFHQGVTDGAEPFDLLQLFAKHIIQVFDGLFLKCNYSFNFPPSSWLKMIYLTVMV